MNSYLFWHVILPKYQKIECAHKLISRLDPLSFEPLIYELFQQCQLYRTFPDPLQAFVLDATLHSKSVLFSVYHQEKILTVSVLNLQNQKNPVLWHNFLDKFEDLYFVPAIPGEHPWLLSYIYRPTFSWLPDLLEEIAILILKRNS